MCFAGSARNASTLTFDGVDVMGHRLAEEVAAFMKTKFGSFLKKATYGNCRLSFVGHSMGNIIIRAALKG